MISKPEDYKWCSYGEAMQPKNNEQARKGLCRVLGVADDFNQQRTTSLAIVWSGEDGVPTRYLALDGSNQRNVSTRCDN